MNEHAGLGCALSVLIVFGFALIFHEKERPIGITQDAPKVRTKPRLTEQNRDLSTPFPIQVAKTQQSPKALEQTSISPPQTKLKAIEVKASSPVISMVSSKSNGIQPTSGVVPDHEPLTVAPPKIHRPVPRHDSSTPRSAITVIAKGERLVDVAIRVYGTAEATVKLWRANRDRLTSVDDPVSDGWLLRTP